MGIAVWELQLKPFIYRSLEDQIRIVKEGPSRPKFHSLLVAGPDFTELVYSKAQWVTGCPKRNGFFCWTCLLFGNTEWVYLRNMNSADAELRLLTVIMREHEKTFEHIQSEFFSKMFWIQHIKSPHVEGDMKCETETDQNDVLNRLIDVVFKNVVQVANRREGKYCGQLNAGECVSILQLIRNYDNYHFTEVESTIELIKKSPNIVCDIVDAMTKIVKLAIKKETQLSTFVSLILSEHSEMPSLSLVSTVLRYVKDGHVRERFVGYSVCSNESIADDLCKHIRNIIEEFDMSGKFLAFSVDGGIQPLFQFLKLVEDLKQEYPSTYFVPWYAHKLEYVLQQSLSYYKVCDHFFKTLNAIENFLIKNSELWQAFEAFMRGKHFSLVNFDWFIKASTINVIQTHRAHFVEFFELVVRNSKKWDADDVVKALGFKRFLQEFPTVFLLQVISTLMDLTDSFRRSFQGDAPRNAFHPCALKSLIKRLVSERGNGFEKEWAKTVAGIDEENSKIPQTKKVYREYRELFNNIFYRTIRDLETRFDAMSKFDLPCRIVVRIQGTQDSYIDFYMGRRENAQLRCFQKEDVENEVTVLKKKAAEFPFTSLDNMYQYFLESNIKEAMPNVFKLAEFTLTLPIQRPACENSRLQEIIMSEPFNAKDVATSGDISVLCVELDLLRDLKNSESFYNDVISAFDTRERTTA